MKDKHKVLFLLLLLAAIMGGLVMYWSTPMHTKPPGAGHSPAESEAAAESQRSITTDGVAGNPQPASTAIGEEKAPLSGPADLRPWRVSLRTLSLDGTVVPDINVEYILVSQRKVLMMSDTERLAIPWATAKTDSLGHVVLEAKETPQEKMFLVVRPLSLTWKLPEGRRKMLSAFADAESCLVKDGDCVDVGLSRSNRISLNIRYADGAPFSGRAIVVFLGRPTDQGKTPQFLAKRDCLVSADEPCEVEYPEAAVSAKLRIVGLRFGFVNTFNSKAELSAASRTLDVEIPATELPWAGVHLDLGGFSSGDGWNISLSGDGAVVSEGVLEWGKAYDNYTLHPGRDLVVRLSGPFGVWESGTFQLAENEVREFTPVVSASVSVRLRIVDQSGTPQYPGFVSTRLHDMTRWQVARVKGRQLLIPGPRGEIFRTAPDGNGIQAFAASDGTVELSGVAPSVTQLFVEAPGSERTRVRLTARAGDTLDLGDIVVIPAQGEIAVRFKNVPSNVFLKTCLLKMPVVGDFETLPVGANNHTFKNVSTDRGKYFVWASRGEGYGPVQVEVFISAEAPRVEIEIDINDMKPGVGMAVEQEERQE